MAPFDYSRWDKLELSDDEEEPPAAPPIPPKPPPPKPPPPKPMPKLEPTEAAMTDPFSLPMVQTNGTRLTGSGLGRAAIASTMKDVVERIESWVKWHLWVGFEQLYLFFDDADEADSIAVAQAAGGAAVRVIKRDQELIGHWSRQPSWKGHEHVWHKEVQVRQSLNVQYAMELARKEGITWLLNIDSDELFLPSTTSHGADEVRGAVPALFEALAAAGVETFAFSNHEARVTLEGPKATCDLTSLDSTSMTSLASLLLSFFKSSQVESSSTKPRPVECKAMDGVGGLRESLDP